jgi:hypothetical protein
LGINIIITERIFNSKCQHVFIQQIKNVNDSKMKYDDSYKWYEN